jgi:hypothetical protein
MLDKDITDAWAKIRKIDSTIPDEVLDFMRSAALEKLEWQKIPTAAELRNEYFYLAYNRKYSHENLFDFWTNRIKKIMNELIELRAYKAKREEIDNENNSYHYRGSK